MLIGAEDAAVKQHSASRMFLPFLPTITTLIAFPPLMFWGGMGDL